MLFANISHLLARTFFESQSLSLGVSQSYKILEKGYIVTETSPRQFTERKASHKNYTPV